jgi:Protein of unknown function (DUF3300)
MPRTVSSVSTTVGSSAVIAQVLAASRYSDQIPDAANWADQHSSLKGDALANAIRENNLPWDPSVLALLPFPSVLDVTAQDPQWTQQLGQAVLVQRPDGMDAVQRQPKQAYRYGYLRTNPYDTVTDSGGYMEVLPVNPAYIYVPAYDPLVVFGPRPAGFVIGGALRFGPAIVIGASFWPWGWAHPYLPWGVHGIFFDDVPWGRSWRNRGFYTSSVRPPLGALGRASGRAARIPPGAIGSLIFFSMLGALREGSLLPTSNLRGFCC